MLRSLIALAAVLVLSMQAAFAQEGVLSFANDPADMYEHLELDGHRVVFPDSSYGGLKFSDSISFYGHRYGDVGDLLGSVVIFGPQSAKTRQMPDFPDSPVVYSTSLFQIADVPETPGWFEVPIELLELPAGQFSVVIYTHSNAERGLDMGLAPSLTGGSQSYVGRVIVSEEDYARDPAAYDLQRKDGREWLVRVHASMNSGRGAGISSDSISGSGFGVHDDGSAEAWADFRDNGGVVTFDNGRKRRVDAIYIHARLGGDWFGTDRNCSVVLMNRNYNIIKRMSIPYTAFNEDGSWAKLEVPDTEVDDVFLVLVQPRSEKNIRFLLGADQSGNQASSVGTIGAPKDWEGECAEADTNWMIRVHYSK